jgi:hypothetical protein
MGKYDESQQEAEKPVSRLKDRYDELQQEAEKLVSLLKDREVGLAAWHGMVNARMTTMRNLYFGKPKDAQRRAADEANPYDAGQRASMRRR